jgi:hypothetical protein
MAAGVAGHPVAGAGVGVGEGGVGDLDEVGHIWIGKDCQ